MLTSHSLCQLWAEAKGGVQDRGLRGASGGGKALRALRDSRPDTSERSLFQTHSGSGSAIKVIREEAAVCAIGLCVWTHVTEVT